MPLLTEHIKQARLAMAAPYIKGHVLDLGCGRAEVLAACAPAIASYTGVEYSAPHVARLQQTHPKATFFHRDLDDEPLALTRRYDAIVMLALVEHIYNQKRLFTEAVQALAPEGRIVITTPTPFGNDIIHRAGARLGFFSKDAADDHVVIYNRKRFQILARDLGLEILTYQRFQLGCNQLVVLRAGQSKDKE